MSPVRTRTLCLAAAFNVTAAWAEGPPPPSDAPVPQNTLEDSTHEAITLAHRGRTNFEAGDFAGALANFRAAQKLARSPVFDLYVARSQKQLGRWIEARSAYQGALLNPDAPLNTPWTEAKVAAEVELKTLESELPHLTVTAQNLGPEAPTVEIDGIPLNWPVVGAALNPGDHQLTAHFGQAVYSTVVHAKPHELALIHLPFRSHAIDTKPVPPSPPQGPDHTLRPWAIGALSLGGASLAVGTITGIMTLSTASTLNTWCNQPENSCPNGVPSDPYYRELQADARPIALAATTALVSAAVFSAVGVSLWLLDSSRKTPKSAALTLRLDSLGIACHGRF